MGEGGAFWGQNFLFVALHSPDLNLLNYSILSVVEFKACWTSHKNVDSLKVSITETWSTMSEDYIVNVCKGLRSKKGDILATNGGYIK